MLRVKQRRGYPDFAGRWKERSYPFCIACASSEKSPVNESETPILMGPGLLLVGFALDVQALRPARIRKSIATMAETGLIQRVKRVNTSPPFASSVSFKSQLQLKP